MRLLAVILLVVAIACVSWWVRLDRLPLRRAPRGLPACRDTRAAELEQPSRGRIDELAHFCTKCGRVVRTGQRKTPRRDQRPGSRHRRTDLLMPAQPSPTSKVKLGRLLAVAEFEADVLEALDLVEAMHRRSSIATVSFATEIEGAYTALCNARAELDTWKEPS